MTKYKWMLYKDIVPYIEEMEKQKVSEVARGVKQSSQTDYGFLEVYEYVRDPEEMYKVYVKRDKEGEVWGNRRDNFVARTLAQYEKNPTRRRYLALIAWAYKPKKTD